MAIVHTNNIMPTPGICETNTHIPLVLSFNEEGIACLQCTFINAYGAKTCAMCFSPLPQKARKKIVMMERSKPDIKSPSSDTPETSSASAANVAADATSKPATTTKKAWSGWKKPTKEKPKQSLQEIMNQQLAQQTAEIIEKTKPTATPATISTTMAAASTTTAASTTAVTDPAEASATSAADATPAASSVAEMDADFALALKMQMEWAVEDQRQARNLQQQSTKVRLSTQRMGAAPYSAEALGHISSQTELEGPGEWEPEIDESQEFITKHDPVLTGIKNTKRLAQQFNLRGLVEDRVLLNGRVANQLARHLKKKTVKGEAKHGKRAQEEFATRGETFDQRTKLVLFKWQNEDVLGNLHGCFRTGKEAQLYQANLPNGQDAAVKVFHTTVTKFTNRAEYIQNDHRFVSKLGGNAKNRRKLVQVWTEKEFKNLNRLHRDGVPCPKPYFFREHLLCMEFIGSKGHAAPQLREVPLSKKKLRRAYEQVILAMWNMFNRCKLVHADLSEYNMLWHQNTVVIIDLGQAVNATHPQALQYLKRDCETVTRFFHGNGLSKSRLMSAQSLFDLVCTPPETLRELHTPDIDTASATTTNTATTTAAAAKKSSGGSGGGVGELVIEHWRAMVAEGQHQTPSRPLEEATKRSGWKADYASRMQSSLVTPHEAMEDMTSAQFDSLGHS